MVVGDRLWLFSQPPHGPPAPIQSLLLNNVPPAPQHISSLHPSVLARSYASPSASQMMPRQNQGYNMNALSPSPGFMNKQMRFDYFNKLHYNRVSSEQPADFRFDNKPIFKLSDKADEPSTSSVASELANLESRFGNNSSILNENSGKFQEAININEDTENSSSSEIDCEEIEN